MFLMDSLMDLEENRGTVGGVTAGSDKVMRDMGITEAAMTEIGIIMVTITTEAEATEVEDGAEARGPGADTRPPSSTTPAPP